MNLRGHLDAEAFTKLLAVASKQAPREKALAVKTLAPQAIEPSADVKRWLAKAKVRIERHERRKQAHAARSAAPKTPKPAPAGVKANRSRKLAPATAETRKVNGLPLPEGTLPATKQLAPVVRPMPKQVTHNATLQDARLQAVKNQAMRTVHKKDRKPDAKVRLEVAESQLELSESELLALCDELSIEPLSKDGMEYLTGADFEKLRYHIPVKGIEPKLTTSSTFEARLRLTYGANQWAAEGTPLERYEAK